MTRPNQTRSDLLALLVEIGNIRPEWRLGQTLANIAMMAGKTDAGAVWDLEDEEAISAAQEILRQYTPSKSVGYHVSGAA
jgi:hypothetical protein